ncbi:hypothetical protein ACLKA7_000113 [Drosophila subpalustris]
MRPRSSYAPSYARARQLVHAAVSPLPTVKRPAATPQSAVTARRFQAPAPVTTTESVIFLCTVRHTSILLPDSVDAFRAGNRPTADACIAAPAQEHGPDRSFLLLALYDPCAAVSSVSASLAAQLKLPALHVGEDRVCKATLASKVDADLRFDGFLKNSIIIHHTRLSILQSTMHFNRPF